MNEYPINAKQQDAVDYEPDYTERNGNVVSYVESCITTTPSYLMLS